MALWGHSCHKLGVLCNPQKSAILFLGLFGLVASLWQVWLSSRGENFKINLLFCRPQSSDKGHFISRNYCFSYGTFRTRAVLF
jgi:hypothetical protein